MPCTVTTETEQRIMTLNSAIIPLKLVQSIFSGLIPKYHIIKNRQIYSKKSLKLDVEDVLLTIICLLRDWTNLKGIDSESSINNCFKLLLEGVT